MKRYDTDVMAGLVIPAKPAWTACDTTYRDPRKPQMRRHSPVLCPASAKRGMPGSCGHAGVRRMTPVESLADSSLVRRIAAAPHLQAADEARPRVNDWRAEIAGVSAGKTLTRLAAAHPRLDALITGLAGGSPYLWDLVR